MTWSHSQGFRIPGTVSLPMMSRALERHAWPTWRVEAVRALALVSDELLAGADDREAVFRRLSHGQLGEVDLVVSRAQGAGLLMRAAEFLDVVHAFMHRPAAIPVQAALDLRCVAQFMDDPADDEHRWLYVLLQTESTRMESMFSALRDVEPYPVPLPGEPAHEDDVERAEVWHRVLGRYTGFSPPSIVAPQLHLAFEVVESIGSDHDDELAVQGKVTASEVIAEVALRRGGADVDELREALLSPL